MDVVLGPHKGRNLATGVVQTHPQYRVLVDGTLVGYKSWTRGKAICFIGQISPADRLEIEQQVDNILGDGAGSIQPAPDTEEPSDEKEAAHDDFDS